MSTTETPVKTLVLEIVPDEQKIQQLEDKICKLVERVAVLERTLLLCENCGSDKPNRECKQGYCLMKICPKCDRRGPRIMEAASGCREGGEVEVCEICRQRTGPWTL